MMPKAAEWMARHGLTDEQIAEELGIAVSTFYAWQEKYPEFSEAIKRGKEEPDDLVEAALFKRAIGYDVEEHKEVYENGLLVKTEDKTVHVHPSDTAIIFWLKNRRSDRWRDKQEHEHSGPGGKPIEVNTKTPTELIEEYEELLQGSGDAGGDDRGKPMDTAQADKETS